MFRAVRFKDAMVALFGAEPGQAHWAVIDAKRVLRRHRYRLLSFADWASHYGLVNDAVPNRVTYSGFC